MGMMRLLINPAGYGYVKVRAGYDGEVFTVPNPTDIKPLDPIDPDIVGALRIEKILEYVRDMHFTLLERIINVAHMDCSPLEKCTKEAPNWPQVKACYTPHLKDLSDVGIVKNVDFKKLKWVSSYFAVPKTSDSMRSIFNGSKLSHLTAPPPPVNLMSTGPMIQHIRDHLRSHRKVWVVQADLRHWFHQIPVSNALSYYFGLKQHEGGWLRWRTLPMGWSWSPAIAQALSWAVVANAGTGVRSMYDTSALCNPNGRMPFYLPMRGGQGTAFVYYDNVVILANSENAAKEARIALVNSCRQFHAVIKGEVSISSPKEIEDRGVDILGVHLQLHRAPNQQGDVHNWTRFSVRPAKAGEWLQELPAFTEAEVTARQAASLLGRMVFSAVVTHQDLFRALEGRAIIRLASDLGRHAAKTGWDSIYKWPANIPSAVQVFKANLETPRVQELGSRRIQAHAGEIIVATDASKKGYGYLFFDHDYRIIGNPWMGRWPSDDRRHIFLKELHVALDGLAAAAQQKFTRVRLVTDNVAVAWTTIV